MIKARSRIDEKHPISRKRWIIDILLIIILLSVTGYLIYQKLTDNPGKQLKELLYALYIPPFVFSDHLPGPDQGHLILVREGDVYGYKDENGNMVIEPQYAFASEFVDGRASVALDNNDYGNLVSNYRTNEAREDAWKNDFEAGIIDETGNFLWSYPSLDALPSYFSEGLARVCILGRYGFIDRQGNMVIKPRFNAAGSFSDGRALVFIGAGNDRHCFMIDTAGNVIEEITSSEPDEI